VRRDLPPDDDCVRLSNGKTISISRCAYVANGQRCAFPGSISHTTMNHGPSGKDSTGDWWCRYHFDCNDARFGAQVVEDSLKPPKPKVEQPSKPLPVRTGNHAWAHRIMDTHAAGEKLPSIALQWARQALGTDEKQSANPGGALRPGTTEEHNDGKP
jgi:hypothetical protein